MREKLLAQSRLFTAIIRACCMATVISACMAPQARSQAIKVVVGYTSVQPPYIINENGTGLTFELTRILNQISPQYKFEAHRFYPARIGNAIDEKRFDIIAFNNLLWGWAQSGATQSLTLIHDRDIYFTRETPLSRHASTKLAATRGFTYAFADYSIEKLNKLPNVLLVDDEIDTIPLVRRGRAAMGIASEALLRWQMHANGGGQVRLKLLSEVDHEYDRAFIVLPHSKLPEKTLNNYLLRLKASGDLKTVFERYGLAEPSLAPATAPKG